MDKLPKRKPTRWSLIDYSSQGLYFLTICTRDRRNLLSHIVVGDGASTSRENDTPTVQLTEIGKVVEKYILSTERIENVILDKYVIMPNHIHMIVFFKGVSGTSRAPSPTNEIVPHVVSTFKRFCNKEIGENVFQRSYYDHVIRDGEDYEARVNYIFENPMRWYYDELYNE